MDVQLVVAGGSKAGQVIPITGPKFIIGRADDCHLKPRSELISRYHCAVISEDGYVAIRDLGSKNGVYLNGERVSMEHELKNGDKLSIGPLEFFVHLAIELKGQKKPKVESISEAVTRTVEIQSTTTKPDEKEAEIADWLLSAGESEQDQETKTIDASDLLNQLQSQSPAEPEKNPKEESGTFKKPDAPASSRDAAANLLKNFFKGGR
ncbi:MAG: FHA domain-containing protein [Planctomycetaceae bacterium]|jgi:pSer/pThr/pTyr-binding forkhead associated (FHA) protein|nr:FHA domain-containing protein [Planctomycetaceae bacterium]